MVGPLGAVVVGVVDPTAQQRWAVGPVTARSDWMGAGRVEATREPFHGPSDGAVEDGVPDVVPDVAEDEGEEHAAAVPTATSTTAAARNRGTARAVVGSPGTRHPFPPARSSDGAPARALRPWQIVPRSTPVPGDDIRQGPVPSTVAP